MTPSDDIYDSYAMIVNEYGKHAVYDPFTLQRKQMERNMEQSVEEEIMKDMEQYGSAAYTDPELKAKFEAQRQRHEEEEMDAKREMFVAGKRRYDLPKLGSLEDYAVRESEGQYMIIMRKYNIGHKKRRVSSLVNKINLFTSGKKQRLVIRENRQVDWRGVLGIVFGLFSFLLCLLLGQFFEPEKRKTIKTIRKSNGSMGSSGASSRSSGRRLQHGQTRRKYSNGPKAYGGYRPDSNSYSY